MHARVVLSMRRSTLALGAFLVFACSNGAGTAAGELETELFEGEPTPTRTPPMSLTASDGTGLRLVSLAMRAALDDPMAFTEVHLTFENPNDRIIEGNFTIMLPPGASLSRFAMKIDDAWQEGEVVEKQKARAAYEDALHRRQDPALLEQAAGNEFTARVFPIPANGKKEIVIAYSHVLEQGAAYTFPLEGLPRLDALSLQVSGRDRPLASVERTSFLPGNDLSVRAERFERSGGLRAGEYVMTRFVPFVDDRPDALGSCVILFDTSASRALGLDAQTELLRRLVDSLPSGSRVKVLAFDQTTDVVFDGDKAAFGAAEVARLHERGALGASDLAAALAAVGAGATTGPGAPTRLVVIGDGVATAGETDAKKLRGHVESLQRTSLQRIDAIVLGGLRDQPALESIVRGGLARDGVVLDAKAGFETVRRKLDRATHSKVPVRVDGATWSYPDRLDGVQAGDEVRVYAQVPVGVVPQIAVDGKAAVTPTLHDANSPLLERAWASAKIQSLLESPPEGDAELGRAAIIDVSRTHRVISPHTAMLVLETDADYARFGIDRKAKVDVLTVEGGRVTTTHVSRVEPSGNGASFGTGTGATFGSAAPSSRAAIVRETMEFGMIGLLPQRDSVGRSNAWGDDIGESFGSGGLTLFGSGGFASSGSGAHATTGPRVGIALPSVHGRLPPEVVLRIVRQNLGRVRRCYEDALRTRPDAEGVVSVRLVIDRSGSVARASDGGASTFPSEATTACVVRQMNSLSFPQPEGGPETVFLQVTLGDVAPRNEEPAWFRTLPPVARPARAPSGHKVPGVEKVAPYTGRFEAIMQDLASKNVGAAVDSAKTWQHEAPGDVMALVALGEAHEAAGNRVQAARAYGSILELFSSRADSRRFAGERLERLGTADAFGLAADAFRGAVAQRPDHPAGHRLLAYSLLRDGRPAEAFAALEAGVNQHYRDGRFAGAQEILREDLALVALAWRRSNPEQAGVIEDRLKPLRVSLDSEAEPSVRFVLVWETDANDVDFHIDDGQGGHAYYGNRELPSGGSLYADVTTGYGPECFTVRGPAAQRAYPYRLSAQYFSRGPMGHGMGKLQIVEHDGKGGLRFDERPFVIMTDHAFVDLGVVRGTL